VTSRVVALLRGINVGTSKQVPMARLRQLLTELGYTDVQTLLRSGNAVFSCPAEEVAAAAGAIEASIRKVFGFDSRVVVRTGAELARAIADDPLLGHLGNPARHLVGFLSAKPSPARVRQLTTTDFGADQLRLVDRHLYLWCPAGFTASPFAKLDFDRILAATVTTRNWNTVTKLATMLA
jgi:uncharacterized protein (DUF1697 family)